MISEFPANQTDFSVISMTIPHCICCPSCRLLKFTLTCFVCHWKHCLPRGRVTSSLWSVLCSSACRGTVRLPLTISVLRMWMWNHLHTVFVSCLFVLVISPWCARCSRPGSKWICRLYQMDGACCRRPILIYNVTHFQLSYSWLSWFMLASLVAVSVISGFIYFLFTYLNV